MSVLQHSLIVLPIHRMSYAAYYSKHDAYVAKQKAILEMRINEQLSYDEIAKMSGRSVSTIKASVFFALEKLRKLVKDHRKK